MVYKKHPKIDLVQRWMNRHPRVTINKEFIESIVKDYEENDELTPRQEIALDNIIKGYAIKRWNERRPLEITDFFKPKHPAVPQ